MPPSTFGAVGVGWRNLSNLRPKATAVKQHASRLRWNGTFPRSRCSLESTSGNNGSNASKRKEYRTERSEREHIGIQRPCVGRCGSRPG
ncbi:MAG: hypothetical protein LBQ54_01520 [Planctomycetaceae bacterium]|nr:hypothetical protein [Planctomycetaceae bacterium]